MAFERRNQRGFVLAVTLWLLAGMAVAVALMTLWARDEVVAATVGRDAFEDEAAALTLRETILYLAATRERTRAGLRQGELGEDERAVRRLEEFGAMDKTPRGDELSLDATLYSGVGGIQFTLQDHGGQYPLLLPGDASLDALLVAAGIDPAAVPALRDAYLDYVDADDVARLNGAEARDYARQDRPPPPNRFLLAPAEIRAIRGWDALEPEVLLRLEAMTQPYAAGPLNLNAAPEPVLARVLGGECDGRCDRIRTERRRMPFVNSMDFEARTGVRLAGDPFVDYRFGPSESFVLTTWGRIGGGWRLHVRLTPLADKAGPWTVLAAYPVPRPPDDTTPQIPESPLLADAAPRRHAGARP